MFKLKKPVLCVCALFLTVFIATLSFTLPTAASSQNLTNNLTVNESDNPKFNESSPYALQDMFVHGTGATPLATAEEQSEANGTGTFYTWRINSLPACTTKLKIKAVGATDPASLTGNSSYGLILMLYKISSGGTALQEFNSIIQGTDNLAAFGNDHPDGIYVWSKESPSNYALEAEWNIPEDSTDQFGIAILQALDEDNGSGAFSAQATVQNVEASGANCPESSSITTTPSSSPTPAPPKTAGTINPLQIIIATTLSLIILAGLAPLFKKSQP